MSFFKTQGGWDHITVRGNALEAPRILMPSLNDSGKSHTTPHGLQPAEMNGNTVGC